MDANNDVYSLGYMSGLYQQSPKKLAKTLQEAGHKPCFSLNGVPHYSIVALNAVGDSLRAEAATAAVVAGLRRARA